MPTPQRPYVYLKSSCTVPLICLLPVHLSIAYHGITPFHLLALSAQREEPRLAAVLVIGNK
jgi:hypothetical protein